MKKDRLLILKIIVKVFIVLLFAVALVRIVLI